MNEIGWILLTCLVIIVAQAWIWINAFTFIYEQIIKCSCPCCQEKSEHDEHEDNPV